MARRLNRRTFLGHGTCGLLAGSAALCTMPELAAKSPTSTKGVGYYEKLGVTPLINAAGTYTVLSASTMPDQVQAAIPLAANQPVNLTELHDAAGEHVPMRHRY